MKDLLRPGRWLTALAAVAVLGTSADAQTYPTELYDNLRWENIGPAKAKVWNSPFSPQGSTPGGKSSKKL